MECRRLRLAASHRHPVSRSVYQKLSAATASACGIDIEAKVDFLQLRPRELRRFRGPANHIVPPATASLGYTTRASALVRGRYSARQRPVIPALEQDAFAIRERIRAPSFAN